MRNRKSVAVLKNVAKLEMDELILRRSGLTEQEKQFASDALQIEEQLLNEENTMRDDVLWYQTFYKYKEAAEHKLKTIALARSILNAEIEKLSEQILQLHIEQKKYDKLQELANTRSLKEARVKDQKELDALGILQSGITL